MRKNEDSSRALRPEGLLFEGQLQRGLEVVVQGDRISEIRAARGEPDCSGILPGFVNAHSHAFQRALRGHVQHAAPGMDDFWTWRERMYGLANELDADGIEAVSEQAFREMARAGFTSVGEFHYVHHLPEGSPYADREELARRVIRAARRVGLRICLLRVAYHRAGPGQDRTRQQRRFCDDRPQQVLDAVRRLQNIQDPAVSIGLAPHSVRAVPRDWLEVLASFDGVIHAHLSEQPKENTLCQDEHGVSPTRLLADCGLLSERFTAVHMTWPCEGDAELLRQSGASICACPSTELDLGDGFLPLDHFADIPICVGTDSHARIDPFYELAAIELHARGCQGRRNVLATEEPDGLALRLLEMGSRNGARSLGLDAGEIAIGKLADFVEIDLDHPVLQGSRVLPAAVLAGHPGLVRRVWVGGELLE